MINRDQLVDLLVEWEERRTAGDEPTPEELCRHDTLLCEELRKRISRRKRQFARNGHLPTAGCTSGSGKAGHHGSAGAAEALGEQAGARYRRLRFLAKGGLGEVHVASDLELGREVALKEIQRHLAYRDDLRSRFLLEAEITGGLEHPGIVPIYSLRRYPDGRPYYAMRYVEGASLKDAIKSFRGVTPIPNVDREREPGRFASCWADSSRFATPLRTLIAAAYYTETSSPAISCWGPLARPWSSTGAWRRRPVGATLAATRSPLMANRRSARPRL